MSIFKNKILKQIQNGKQKAFTLAELMVLIAILTVLFAAFAPVFTTRYNNASIDDVWSFVQDDVNGDAYSDVLNKALPSEFFIGLTPTKASDITSTYAPYSKLVIRGSNSLTSGKKQAQMDFRYGNSNSGNGSLVSSLFAGNGNILLGGPFRSITDSAKYNTSFGVGTLNKLSSGSNNTAVGYNSLKSVTSGSNNTSIGVEAGKSVATTSNNTFIGFESGKAITGADNTLIGNDTMKVKSGNRNTIVGAFAGQELSGDDNTAIGAMAMHAHSSGSANTAVGAYSLVNGSGSYNTAIGYNACSSVNGSYKTCIGKDSGSSKNTSDYDGQGTFTGGSMPASILSDDKERVLIGSTPKTNFTDGAAVLEVHNVGGTNSSSLGNASVVINGNLIIRGQTFTMGTNTRVQNGFSLMSYGISHPKDGTYSYLVGGSSGSHETYELEGNCKRPHHAATNGWDACICAYAGDNNNGIVSYDWSTTGTNGNCSAKSGFCLGGSYIDKSTNVTINKGPGGANDDIVVDRAHGYGGDGDTCCPYLKSDARLKNIGSPFTGGLEQLKKIKVFNYTFKNDKYKLAHVGVIAQDLKLIFPIAVSKAENGYYTIRWDEMFYSAINAIKELNTRIEELVSRVKNDIARIENLKKDNKQLEKQLDILAEELNKLEK